MNSIEYASTLSKDFGHSLEFGVFNGTTIQQIRNIVKNEVFGFDSFEGLPEDWEGTICHKGFFTTNGNVPNIPGVVFYKGWFENTITEYLKIAKEINLLHIDCDLYSSTKTVLYNLNKFIVKNTIICFDEWVYCKSDGKLYADHEQKCFYEWVEENNREFEFIDFLDQTPCGHERKIIRIIK